MIKEQYKLLKEIEVNPAMWTGIKTLYSIHTFLGGYYKALSDYNLIDDFTKPEPFFDWVAYKLGFNDSTAGWANMILASSIGISSENINWNNFLIRKVTIEEHELSIIMFYKLLEEYVNDSRITPN